MSKILLVEDDKNQALLYRQELEAEGYEVEVAGNGREACELVESVDPDIVVMDISMPGMDGIEAMGRMLSKHNKLPVILNTAYSSYKDNFLSWSADAYVIKSSDLSELKDTIEKLLKSSKASEEETE
ncbi:MAG: response regulator [Planctomycetota bacterium]